MARFTILVTLALVVVGTSSIEAQVFRRLREAVQQNRNGNTGRLRPAQNNQSPTPAVRPGQAATQQGVVPQGSFARRNSAAPAPGTRIQRLTTIIDRIISNQPATGQSPSAIPRNGTAADGRPRSITPQPQPPQSFRPAEAPRPTPAGQRPTLETAGPSPASPVTGNRSGQVDLARQALESAKKETPTVDNTSENGGSLIPGFLNPFKKRSTAPKTAPQTNTSKKSTSDKSPTAPAKQSTKSILETKENPKAKKPRPAVSVLELNGPDKN